ncbi:hypothetical protein J6590_057350 [Homalodisca vitripennis]|nr:hypothetical protein J6590_057350 [Homalodisca vitripennis]
MARGSTHLSGRGKDRGATILGRRNAQSTAALRNQAVQERALTLHSQISKISWSWSASLEAYLGLSGHTFPENFNHECNSPPQLHARSQGWIVAEIEC